MLFVIAGLGNPGEKYRLSRHNIGFWVVDILAERHGIVLEPDSNSLIGHGRIKDKPVCLLQPQTFMNLSGEAVAALVSETGISFEHLAVAHDDLDLELGRIQVRNKGGDGGHRGVRSIIQHLDSCDFVRLRLGIGRPLDEKLTTEQTKEFVLSGFSVEEQREAKQMAHRAADAIEVWIHQGIVAAMNSFNRWKNPRSTQEAM